MLGNVADHLHEEWVLVLEGVPHEKPQTVCLTDQLGTPLVGGEVDAQGDDLQIGLVFNRTQQHLHHLRHNDTGFRETVNVNVY